jgi:hypothetical protein
MTHLRGTFVRLSLTAAFLLRAPSDVRGQSVKELRASIATSQVFDSNLFSTPSNPQSDFITRLTSSVDAERRSARLIMSGRYSLDAERFADHRQLSSANARQHASVAAEYRSRRRLTFEIGMEMWTTSTPEDFMLDTGLTPGRAAATRGIVRAAAARRFTPRSTGRVDVELTGDEFAGTRARNDTVTISGTRSLSLRGSVHTSYGLSQYRFVSPVPIDPSTRSQVATVGVTRQLKRRVTASIEGGPRVTGRSWTPEVSGSISYAGRVVRLSAAYARTQTIVVGQASPSDTQSLTVSAVCTPRRSLEIHLEPGVYRNDLAGRRLDAYGLSAGARQDLGRGLAIEIAFDGRVQLGRLSSVPARSSVNRSTAQIRLVFAPSAIRY